MVDDDPHVRSATGALLRGHCQVLETYSSAAEALAACTGALPPDFLIADLRLPGPIDGLVLIGQVRSATGLTVPSILITGEHQLPVPDSGNRIIVMRKPVDPRALIQAMRLELYPHWTL
jgi:CheY-like chemotaxis protein